MYLSGANRYLRYFAEFIVLMLHKEINMENRNFIAFIVVLVFVLGIQFYMIQKMDDKLTRISQNYGQFIKPHPKTHSQPKRITPLPDLNDKFYNDDSWSPYDEMQRMKNELGKLFGDSFSRFHLYSLLGGFSKTPDINIQEKSDRYIVTVNASGADKFSLKVKLEDQQLHIFIETKHADDFFDDRDGQYTFREQFMGEFQRVLTLPGPENATKMKTDYFKWRANNYDSKEVNRL